MKKLKIGWFTFTCSEDSTIVLTELFNDYYREWKRIIDFKSIHVMKKHEELDQLDVAFIEGAIVSDKQAEKLRKIRGIASRLVAVGSCACIGSPSAYRNIFDEKTKKEIEKIILRFQYSESVKKVSDVVAVDDQVPGCPMNEQVFLSVLDKYLKEFGVIS